MSNPDESPVLEWVEFPPDTVLEEFRELIEVLRRKMRQPWISADEMRRRMETNRSYNFCWRDR